MKLCKRCGLKKRQDRFPLDYRATNARASVCRNCVNLSKRQSRRKSSFEFDCWKELETTLAAQGIRVASVDGFPNYRVSTNGIIWGVGLSRERQRRSPKPIKGRTGKTGYVGVILYGESQRRRSVDVHTIVLESFIGPRPKGMECRHSDGVRTNNELENLSWSTHVENEKDKDIHGTRLRYESHPIAKLTRDKVAVIRDQWNSGLSKIRQLASDNGVHQSTICDIIYGRTWK